MENREKVVENIKVPKKVTMPKSLIASRAALGDLGNKLPLPNITKKSAKNLKDGETATTSINNDKEKISYSSKQIFEVCDPDVHGRSNPLLVTEYIKDIYDYLLTLETKYILKSDFLSNHLTTAKMRSILVQWMVEVHINFKLLGETLHMSIGILDRYLQLNNNIDRKTLQLVGTTAIIIAGKYEEIFIPHIKDFIYTCDGAFDMTQFLKMEQDILVKLKFKLGRPLSLHFLRRYGKIASVNIEHHNLGKYLLEICLLEYKLCHVNPSLQAAAACCLSISILNDVCDLRKIWTKTLIRYSTYKYSQLKPVITMLVCSLKKIQSSNSHTLKRKYANSSYGKISCNYKLEGPVIKKLIENVGIS